MDLRRLEELEKLAGLTMDPAEKETMLADLVVLEAFVARLPETSAGFHRELTSGPRGDDGPLVKEMDCELVRDNAPAVGGGFFEIPPTGVSNSEERS